jgi:hypothetical protein
MIAGAASSGPGHVHGCCRLAHMAAMYTAAARCAAAAGLSMLKEVDAPVDTLVMKDHSAAGTAGCLSGSRPRRWPTEKEPAAALTVSRWCPQPPSASTRCLETPSYSSVLDVSVRALLKMARAPFSFFQAMQLQHRAQQRAEADGGGDHEAPPVAKPHRSSRHERCAVRDGQRASFVGLEGDLLR